MPFSQHSHSGQFCGHAKNTLEEIVQTAISKHLHTFALTEHMPRENVLDLYPEEVGVRHLSRTLLTTILIDILSSKPRKVSGRSFDNSLKWLNA